MAKLRKFQDARGQWHTLGGQPSTPTPKKVIQRQVGKTAQFSKTLMKVDRFMERCRGREPTSIEIKAMLNSIQPQLPEPTKALVRKYLDEASESTPQKGLQVVKMVRDSLYQRDMAKIQASQPQS